MRLLPVLEALQVTTKAAPRSDVTLFQVPTICFTIWRAFEGDWDWVKKLLLTYSEHVDWPPKPIVEKTEEEKREEFLRRRLGSLYIRESTPYMEKLVENVLKKFGLIS